MTKQSPKIFVIMLQMIFSNNRQTVRHNEKS